MPSRAACYVAAGAAAYAASTAFTCAPGAPALRSAPAAAAADVRAPEGQQGSRMPAAALALGAAAAAAQAAKRGARRSVKALAVGTLTKDVEQAKADYEMKRWAAEKLAAEGAPQAAMVAQNAAAAEAKWLSLEEQLSGAAPAAPAYMPPVVASAPAPAVASFTPVGATPNRALLEEVNKAKADYELKKWAAEKLAAEGAPQAAMVAQNAAAAEAKWLSLEEQLTGAAPAAPAYTPPAAGAAAPVVTGSVSTEEVKKAKDDFELKKWAAEKLAQKGAPQASMVAQYAATAEALWKSLEEKLSGKAPSTPAYVAPPVAATPTAGGATAAAYAASLPDAATADLKKAKEQADLLTWAYEKLVSKGAPQAAMMKGKADQAVATYSALLAQSK